MIHVLEQRRDTVGGNPELTLDDLVTVKYQLAGDYGE